MSLKCALNTLGALRNKTPLSSSPLWTKERICQTIIQPRITQRLIFQQRGVGGRVCVPSTGCSRPDPSQVTPACTVFLVKLLFFQVDFHSVLPLFLSRKFLKSLIRKQPQELLLVIGTGVSAAVAPGIPALCSWRSCIEAVLEAAEQLEVLHPGDVAEFRRKVTKDRDLLVVAHDLIRKMSPVSLSQPVLRVLLVTWFWAGLGLYDADAYVSASRASQKSFFLNCKHFI